MSPGVAFTIEPIVCMGTSDHVEWPDQWAHATKDGLPTAQFEHTILITQDGAEVLTKKLPDSPKYFWET
jgi:methionyl aminopeptidase